MIFGDFQDGAAEVRAAIWRKLGFRQARSKPPANKHGYGHSTVHFRLTVRDRLRALVSGKVMVDIATRIEPQPRRFESAAADLSILPPTFPMEGEGLLLGNWRAWGRIFNRFKRR